MLQFNQEYLENYLQLHCDEPDSLLNDLERDTWQRVVMPRMLSGKVQGRFLSMMSKMLQPTRILEIGTFTGYSALCLLEGLSIEGRLTTIEINDELQYFHQKYFKDERIKVQYGDARTIIRQTEDTFDLIFIDADKSSYADYYRNLINRLNPGGVMLLDNVLWSGKVLTKANDSDTDTIALQELNAEIQNDPSVHNMILPIRDGIMMVMKKKLS
jgi:predicted O-methyltransferase YrrM